MLPGAFKRSTDERREYRYRVVFVVDRRGDGLRLKWRHFHVGRVDENDRSFLGKFFASACRFAARLGHNIRYNSVVLYVLGFTVWLICRGARFVLDLFPSRLRDLFDGAYLASVNFAIRSIRCVPDGARSCRDAKRRIFQGVLYVGYLLSGRYGNEGVYAFASFRLVVDRHLLCSRFACCVTTNACRVLRVGFVKRVVIRGREEAKISKCNIFRVRRSFRNVLHRVRVFPNEFRLASNLIRDSLDGRTFNLVCRAILLRLRNVAMVFLRTWGNLLTCVRRSLHRARDVVDFRRLQLRDDSHLFPAYFNRVCRAITSATYGGSFSTYGGQPRRVDVCNHRIAFWWEGDGNVHACVVGGEEGGFVVKRGKVCGIFYQVNGLPWEFLSLGVIKRVSMYAQYVREQVPGDVRFLSLATYCVCDLVHRLRHTTTLIRRTNELFRYWEWFPILD